MHKFDGWVIQDADGELFLHSFRSTHADCTRDWCMGFMAWPKFKEMGQRCVRVRVEFVMIDADGHPIAEGTL